MSEMQVIIIYEYCLRIRSEYENRFMQQFNNLFSARCKSDDFHDLASVKHDWELVEEITSHILRILQIKSGDDYNV